MAYDVEKVWEHCGNECVVIMFKDVGHRNGYVGIKKDHPLHGLNYVEKPELPEEVKNRIMNSPIGKRGILDLFTFDGELRVGDLFDVHGGITYSGGGDYPIPNKIGLWWFGYDCGHSGDGRDISVMPEDYKKYYLWNNDPVRSLEYCIEECESLSKQLNKIKEELG